MKNVIRNSIMIVYGILAFPFLLLSLVVQCLNKTLLFLLDYSFDNLLKGLNTVLKIED